MYRCLLFNCLIGFSLFLTCCKSPEQPVSAAWVHQQLSKWEKPSPRAERLNADMTFWLARLNQHADSYTAGMHLASDLVQRFHLSGDMQDIVRADSLYQSLLAVYGHGEAGLFRSLATLNITRHRFAEADVQAEQAYALGSERYGSELILFDTRLETGAYIQASKALKDCAAPNQYGYFFRMSKWKHWQGETDSAMYYMQQAALQAGASPVLQEAANGNLADLYLHDGQTGRAAELYQDILRKNPAESHAWKGLARIVLLRDHNTALADSIILAISRHYALPDPWYDRIAVAEERKDTAKAVEYAAFFAQKAGDSIYGNMYNRYLIDVYTGLLHQPMKALALAEKEMKGRATPQTWCWLAWAQHCAGMDAAAKQTYRLHVSGKPLEAPELYQMGMLMKETGRDAQANAYFKAALQNRYDLSPFKVSACMKF